MTSETPRAAFAITRGVVVLTFRGDITAHDVISVREEYLRHPDFRPGMPSIVDMREATMEKLSGAQVRAIAEHGRRIAARRGDYVSAIVAERDAAFGMMRMYEAVGERVGHRAHVFRDLESAEAFLRGEGAGSS